MFETNLHLHPISLMPELHRRYGDDLKLEFSRYRYRPRSLDDERETFHVPSAKVDEAWLASQLESLAPDQELAIHSRVCVGGAVRHIRMVDFEDFSVDHLSSLARVLTQDECDSMHYFFSGRSFHGYSLLLLESTEDWLDFMGRLLLSNIPSKVRVVDARWIGHRIISRFASLRWSARTARHLQYPERVEPSSLLDPGFVRRLKRIRRRHRVLAGRLLRGEQLRLEV